MTKNKKSTNLTELIYEAWNLAVKLLVKKGVRYAVLSPGSRPAPIALAFLRNTSIKTYIHGDERSAAYMASGIAQVTNKPVCLVCTSGTAALNYSAAIAEAFFRKIPLISITADRPPEWTGQADNQAIYQNNLYGKNVKASFNMPVELGHIDAQWFFFRNISEAFNTSLYPEMGPVHINVPLREPLYLFENKTVNRIFKEIIKNIDHLPAHYNPEHQIDVDFFSNKLNKFKKVILAAGYHHPDSGLEKSINHFLNTHSHIVFIPDITSNLQYIPNACCSTDLLLQHADNTLKKELQPELLITIGGPFVSKSFKEFLRKYKAMEHWHISTSAHTTDTFQSLTHLINCLPEIFFNNLSKSVFKTKVTPFYISLWNKNDDLVYNNLIEFANNDQILNEAKVSSMIIEMLKTNTVLHLSNSLPVRLFNYFSLKGKKDIEVYSNRGTSGIDGSLSTAIGSALAKKEKQHILISGDMSFMYDRNGLWFNELPGNLIIIIYNNSGGGIFRTMPGPADQKELEKYFVLAQNFNFKPTALQHNCNYVNISDLNIAKSTFNNVLINKKSNKISIIEVNYNKITNFEALKKLHTNIIWFLTSNKD